MRYPIKVSKSGDISAATQSGFFPDTTAPILGTKSSYLPSRLTVWHKSSYLPSRLTVWHKYSKTLLYFAELFEIVYEFNAELFVIEFCCMKCKMAKTQNWVQRTVASVSFFLTANKKWYQQSMWITVWPIWQLIHIIGILFNKKVSFLMWIHYELFTLFAFFII